MREGRELLTFYREYSQQILNPLTEIGYGSNSKKSYVFIIINSLLEQEFKEKKIKIKNNSKYLPGSLG